MIDLNWNNINDILGDISNKYITCNQNIDLLQEWSKCNTNYLNYCLTNCSVYEVAQIITSQDNYLKKKNTIMKSGVYYNKRQIVMVELGENYNNLSYKHPCIVIDSVGDKIFVVPCTSGEAPRKKDTNEIYKGYMEAGLEDGFKHTTTIILKEARCIDKIQVTYPIRENKSKKFKKVDKEYFKKINEELFKLLFEGQAYRLESANKNVKQLEEKNIELQKELEDKNKEIEILKENLNKSSEVALELEN